MKFSNGCWLNKEGLEVYSPAEAYILDVEKNHIKVGAPYQKIHHRGSTLAGPLLTIELSSPMKDVIKVKLYHYKGIKKKGPEFNIIESPTNVITKEDETSARLTSGDVSVVIDKNDWGMDFYNKDKKITRTGFRGMGYIVAKEGNVLTGEKGVFMREELEIGVGEYIYGLGERFTPFIKNGQSVDIWNEDGGTATEQAYKNIPFYLSNKGYGVFINHPEKVSMEVGSEKVTKVQFSVPGESLEYFIIGGDNLKEVLANYTALTGKPALPPAWSFGLWLTTSFTTDYDEETVTSFIDGMAERDIPLHVFHFDCFWMKAMNWCDFQWDPKVFSEPVAMLKRLKEKGLKICVWINPYIAQESVLFDEGAEKGYLLKRPNQDVWQWDLWQPGMGVVDFTNPEACKWYTSYLQKLIDMGVDCFKTDFGERIPTDVVYHNGADPFKMHNYYSFLFNKVVFELLEKNFGKEQAVLFARSGTAGSQQFPVHWGGDCTSNYESMAESLRGGLSLGLSGFGFWSHDIGGFESTSTPDVYMRWAAFGLLSSHSRLHGNHTYRVPWLYGEEASEVVAYFTKLKCRLMPYLYSVAKEASTIGLPMMRAMILEFQDDPSVAYLDRQYMLGEKLLVAPIFQKDGEVTYYLPKGTWTNFITNEVVSGGQYQTEQHGYKSLPLMVKSGSIIPVGSNENKPDYSYQEGTIYHVFELEEGLAANAKVYEEGSDQVAEIEIVRNGNEIRINKIEGKFNQSQVLFRNLAVTIEDGGTSKEHLLGTLVSLDHTASSVVVRIEN